MPQSVNKNSMNRICPPISIFYLIFYVLENRFCGENPFRRFPNSPEIIYNCFFSLRTKLNEFIFITFSGRRRQHFESSADVSDYFRNLLFSRHNAAEKAAAGNKNDDFRAEN